MAKRKTPAQLRMGTAAKAFLAAASQVQITLSTSVEVLLDGAWARVTLRLAERWVSPSSVGPFDKICSVEDSEGLDQSIDLSLSPNGIEELWLRLVAKWHAAIVDPATTTLKTWLDRDTKKQLRKLATSAWAELFDTPLITEKKAGNATAALRDFQISSVEKMLQMLRTGPMGVNQFATTGPPAWLERDVMNMGRMYWFPAWTPLDLAGSNLRNLVMQRVHCSRANFAGADLTNSDLALGAYPNGNFTEAILRSAKMREVKLQGANLQGADFSDAQLEAASLRSAKCNNAIFVNADLSNANLCCADLAGANLKGANLQKARYDKNTRWPRGFEPTSAMRWMGVGASPMARKQASLHTPRKRLDLQAFSRRLEQIADPAKLEKAGRMLKAGQFQLFAEITGDLIVGVVKSQVKRDLVYSCRISNEGAYGCCTPDLKPCRGLRGSLCKHLLVLIIGLVNSGKIDPHVIDHWMRLSQGIKPMLDKEAMADTLVRYKGAEAGEIDWRPTETIPEDYYAM